MKQVETIQITKTLELKRISWPEGLALYLSQPNASMEAWHSMTIAERDLWQNKATGVTP